MNIYVCPGMYSSVKFFSLLNYFIIAQSLFDTDHFGLPSLKIVSIFNGFANHYDQKCNYYPRDQFLLLEKVHLKIWLMLSYIIYLGIQTYYIYYYNAGTTYQIVMDFSLKISTHSQQFSIRISLSTDESKNKNFHFLHAVPFAQYIQSD